MKKKILTGIILGILTSLLIGCNPKKEEKAAIAPVTDKDLIKAELQTLETAYTDALNARNVENLIYYADDATSFSQNEPPEIGKPAIMEALKNNLATFPKGRTVSFTVKDVFPSGDGNLVVEVGNFKVVDSTNAIKNSGNYISVFERRDGKYPASEI